MSKAKKGKKVGARSGWLVRVLFVDRGLVDRKIRSRKVALAYFNSLRLNGSACQKMLLKGTKEGMTLEKFKMKKMKRG